MRAGCRIIDSLRPATARTFTPKKSTNTKKKGKKGKKPRAVSWVPPKSLLLNIRQQSTALAPPALEKPTFC